MLIKHIRDEDGKPFATVVATDWNKLGVSVCHPRDTFNKKKGVMIAAGRAETNSSCFIPFKHVGAISDAVDAMWERMQKYYKNKGE